MLVALLLLLVFTLRTTVVSIFSSISCPLVVVISMVFINNPGVMSNKRAADAGENGYYSGPKCEDKKEQECHKHPHENSRKIPKTTCKKIVDTIYIEECEE